VTEQIDAIRVLGADPIKKLVIPRVLAATFMLPLMTSIAVVLGVLGSMFIASVDAGVNMTYFLNTTMDNITFQDFFGGLAKTFFFGFFISIIACYFGLNTRGGTVGVGAATTQTVVVTSVVTLISDFFLTKFFMSIGIA
jgi:phospholipid/cholesterol/gamma-HCH transport system permease protein